MKILFRFITFLGVIFFVASSLWFVMFGPKKVADIQQITNLEPLAPEISPNNTLIAFARDGDIWIIDLLRKTQWQVFNDDTIFVFSTSLLWLDDSHIIYQKKVLLDDEKQNAFQFWVIDLQSNEVNLLSDKVFLGKGSPMELSPSKEKIAFAQPAYIPELDTSRKRIQILDIKKNEVYPISLSTTKSCKSANWFLNDSQLIFYCSELISGTKNQFEIERWQYNLDTRTLKLDANKLHTDFAISPNGQRAIYSEIDDSWPPTTIFFVVPIEDHEFKFSRSRALNLRVPDFPPFGVSWAADSNHFVFSGKLRIDGEFESGIWLVKLDE